MVVHQLEVTIRFLSIISLPIHTPWDRNVDEAHRIQIILISILTLDKALLWSKTGTHLHSCFDFSCTVLSLKIDDNVQ